MNSTQHPTTEEMVLLAEANTAGRMLGLGVSGVASRHLLDVFGQAQADGLGWQPVAEATIAGYDVTHSPWAWLDRNHVVRFKAAV